MDKKKLLKNQNAMNEIIRQRTLEEYNEIDISFERGFPEPDPQHIEAHNRCSMRYITCPELWKQLKKLMDYEEPK